MTKKLLAATLLTLAFSSFACGNSPLLNHETASAPNAANPARDQTPPGASTPSNPGTPLAPGACPLEFPKSGLCASLSWDTALSSDAENRATLRFWDKASGTAAGPYRDVDGEVAFVLWMPAMGHGSSPVTITPQGAGVYSATRVYFIMPGAWDVRVEIKKNHQLFEQTSLSVNL